MSLLGAYYGYDYICNQGPTALDRNRYVPLDLIEKEKVSPDTYRLRLATKKSSEPYPVPSCVYVKDDSIQVMRPYTPINHNPYEDGFVDLIVKRYENGSVSRTLSGFSLNEKVHVRGPMMEEYEYKENTVDEVGMIAGGTGITPMYQLMCRILSNKDDHTQLWLIYGNKTLEDIILKHELDTLQKQYPDRLKITYVLEHPPADWTGERGYITRPVIEPMLLNHSKSRKIFVCGPDRMLSLICGQKARDYSQGQVEGILSQMGLTSNEIWKFQ
ncbi:hypothetical protein BDB01DRAFT_842707 [Pilobolus umbonatus]|nr:hypothetical protein BDB01DRAFT_842707 [Pilobolus umbonatus]